MLSQQPSGFCGGIAGGLAVIMAIDGMASSAIILNALAIAAGQAVGLTVIHLGSERWAAAWEKRSHVVLLCDTRRTSAHGKERLYTEVNPAKL